MQTDEEQYPIGPAGLFVNTRDEEAFVRAEWRDIATRLRRVGLWGGLTFGAATVLDGLMIDRGISFWWLLAARLLVMLLGLHLAMVARPGAVPRRRALITASLTFQIAMLVAARLVSVSHGVFNPYMALAGILYTLIFYAYVPMLVPANAWLMPLWALSAIPAMAMTLNPPLTAIVSWAIMMFFSNLVGWQLATQSSRSLRLNWLARRRLEREVSNRMLAEQNLDQLFEVCPVPLLLLNEQASGLLRANDAALALFGNELLGDDRARGALLDALRGGTRTDPIDLRIQAAGGVAVDVLLQARRLRYERDQALLVSLVEITERKRHEDELRRLTQADALTGLYNRRGFFTLAEAALHRADRGPLSVVLFDADHFKRINDEHGHAVGDQVLQHIAASMTAQTREGDVLARIGGEEFALLLPDAPMERAIQLADRMRRKLAATPVRCGGTELSVTLSVGVATLNPDETGIDVALRRADAAMYRAKEAGRNRVETAA